MLTAQQQRGAIDFELTETQFLFDVNRKIEAIVPRERNDAHRLIEEFMVAANVCCTVLLSKDIPALFRVHETPSAEKLSGLREFLIRIRLNARWRR